MFTEEQQKEIEKARSIAIAQLAHGCEKVGKAIDNLTSSGLKRVLKMVCQVYTAEKMLDNTKKIELSEDEQQLIDKVFALQESVLGFMAMDEELKEHGILTQSQKEQNNG